MDAQRALAGSRDFDRYSAIRERVEDGRWMGWCGHRHRTQEAAANCALSWDRGLSAEYRVLVGTTYEAIRRTG